MSPQVLRKLSASIFLLVMSLLVAFHSPVFGYCVNEDQYFVGEHDEEIEACEHECDGHQEPAGKTDPVEHEHLMVSLETEDFQWSTTPLCVVPHFIEVEVLNWTLLFDFSDGDLVGVPISPANPPPPEVPIFRRDAALRI